MKYKHYFFISIFLIFLVGCTNKSSNEFKEEEIEIKKVTVKNSQPKEEAGDETTINQVTFDPHTYEYDTVTGATVTTFGTNPPSKFKNQEEKLSKMFWSNQPPLGLLEGYYYKNEGDFDGGNHGIVEIVTNPDTYKILNVEFNEFTRDDYYEERYSGINKRLSDYAFFQADHTRTDGTLVTVVNGITYLEMQMRKENRVTGNFKTVTGSSTTARNGFMPLAAAMNDWIRKPSENYYYGYAEELENGLISRLQVITSNGDISDVKYDEYFADSKEKMTDEKLKPYYRQSKYYSQEYNKEKNDEFINFANDLTKQIILNNSLEISDKNLINHESFGSYKELAKQIKIK